MGKESKGPAGLSVVYCVPGNQEVQHRVIEGDELAGMQAIVGGYLEKIGELSYGDGVVLDVFCNEDRMALGLERNRLVFIPGRGQFPILGPVLIAGGVPRTGETVSLDEGMIAEAVEHVRTWPVAIVSPVFRASRLG